MESLVGNIDLKESLKQHLEQQLSNASSYLKEISINSFDKFEKLGFPTIKNEDWKYTNFSTVLKNNFQLSNENSLTYEQLSKLLFSKLQGNILVVVNGIYRPEFSTILEKENTLQVRKINNLSKEFIEQHLSKTLAVSDAMTSLNTAFASQALILQIPKGKVVEHPVYLYFIASSDSNIFFHPRTIVVAEENSQIKLAEIHQKQGNHISFSNAFTDIYLDKDANVEYYKIQPDQEEHYHVGTTQVVHKEKSCFCGTTITLGGTIVRNNMNLILNSNHCDSTINGLYVGNNNQHIDNHSLVDHAMPNCLSNELYKGVLNGKSTGVFNGKIFVRQDAQKTNAFQSNKTILLSKDATMNTKPQLEIFADDVKCSHGATIGQLDDEPMFYLRSRGLSESSARMMLVSAFAQDIIEHIKLEPLKELMVTMLEETLIQN
ncbi:MAG: Fe-S cluster assembly protein SufD [Cytophagales bacterium]|nr:MAG: Fe-S cluster assembly protein SufD [Cytophagales bacterium]